MELERVLIVDDDGDFANLVREQLFNIKTIKEVDILQSGVEFFKQFLSKEYSLVILDYILRDIDGLQILIEIEEKGLKMPIVMLTGRGDESVVVDCFNHGVIDYIIKDYENIKSLPERLSSAFGKYVVREQQLIELQNLYDQNLELRKQLGEFDKNSDSLKKENQLLKNEIKNLKEELKTDRQVLESVASAFLSAVDKSLTGMKEYYGHSIAQAIGVGRELNLVENELHQLRLTILLMNIGGIGLMQADLILDQNLNDEQQNRIKTICEGGADIINTHIRTNEIARNVLYQYERWDGKGFPYGLKKDEIPLITRIAQVVKAYNTLLFEGYAGKKFLPDEAFKIISEKSAIYYDPNVVLAFGKTIKK